MSPPGRPPDPWPSSATATAQHPRSGRRVDQAEASSRRHGRDAVQAMSGDAGRARPLRTGSAGVRGSAEGAGAATRMPRPPPRRAPQRRRAASAAGRQPAGRCHPTASRARPASRLAPPRVPRLRAAHARRGFGGRLLRLGGRQRRRALGGQPLLHAASARCRSGSVARHRRPRDPRRDRRPRASAPRAAAAGERPARATPRRGAACRRAAGGQGGEQLALHARRRSRSRPRSVGHQDQRSRVGARRTSSICSSPRSIAGPSPQPSAPKRGRIAAAFVAASARRGSPAPHQRVAPLATEPARCAGRPTPPGPAR